MVELEIMIELRPRVFGERNNGGLWDDRQATGPQANYSGIRRVRNVKPAQTQTGQNSISGTGISEAEPGRYADIGLKPWISNGELRRY